jgi:hypothetical protein
MYVSSYCCVCVLILLYMFPHAAIQVSSYSYIVSGFYGISRSLSILSLSPIYRERERARALAREREGEREIHLQRRIPASLLNN